MARVTTTIGKHLATFNLFRESDGLYVTIADARGVAQELGESAAPVHLCAMSALREALRQADARAADQEGGTGQRLGRIDATASQERPSGTALAPVQPVTTRGEAESLRAKSL